MKLKRNRETTLKLLISSPELIVLEWRIDQTGLHKLTRKNYIKFQTQSSQKWLEWPIKQKNQTILIDFGQKIEFFFHFRFLGKNDLEMNVWGSFR